MAALLLLVVVAGAACSDDDSSTEPRTRQEQVPMTVSIELHGALETTITNRTVVTSVVEVTSDGSQVVPVFGVQTLAPIEHDGIKVMPGVSLIPFQGDGRYTIEPGSPQADVKKAQEGGGASASGAAKSTVRVEWWPVGQGPEEYMLRVKPCKVEIEDEGMKGRVQCPELSGERDSRPRFSMDFRWEKA